MSAVIKVGIFVTLCLVVLGYLILKVEDLTVFGAADHHVAAEFDSVVGLDDKAPVRVAGVRVGRVDGIGLHNNRALVHILLEQPLTLTEGSRAAIANAGILGDKYVELIPGPPTAPPLPPDAILPGTTPVTFDQALGQLSELGGSLQQLTGSLVQQDTGAVIGRLLANLEATSADIRALVAANRDQVTATVSNFERFSGTLATELPELTAQMRQLLAQVDAVVAENRDDLHGSLANIREITSRIETSVDNLNAISSQIASGQGTLGKLIYDEQAHDSLVNTLDSIQEGVGTLTDSLGRIRKFELQLGLEAAYFDGLGEGRSALSLDLDPKSDRFYHVELVDSPQGRVRTKTDVITTTLPDGTEQTSTVRRLTTEDRFTISAQFGFHLGNADLRGGLFESSGGAAVDYHLLQRKLTLSLEAFDFSRENDLDPHLRFSTRYQIHPNIYLVGGYDDFLIPANDTFFLGAGIRWKDDDLKYLLGSVPIN